MKIIFSILLVVLLFSLTACSVPQNVATLQNLDEEATARIKEDNGIKTRLDAINPAAYETKTDATAKNTALSDRIKAVESRPAAVDYSAKFEEIKKIQDEQVKRIAALEKQNTDLKAALDAHTAIPTPTPVTTPVSAGKLTAELVKSTDYVASLEASTEQNVDFTLKLVNSTGVDLTNIRLKCAITCNRDLYLEDEPVMRDLSNNSLIYDVVDWEYSDYIEFDFTRSTGCPYVYLDKNQTLIIKPVLRFVSADDDSRRYTFTIQVVSLSWDVK